MGMRRGTARVANAGARYYSNFDALRGSDEAVSFDPVGEKKRRRDFSRRLLREGCG